MKILSGKWKMTKDGTMVMKWKKRRTHPLTVLDIFPVSQ